MKILITNFRLAERTATEVYVRDVARLLQSGRNTVAVLVSNKGRLAEELEAEGIAVAEHPSDVPIEPDIIHGQFNLETVIALLSFPDTPAVYLSHGNRQWREHPPLHPRIRRYLALSTQMGEWLKDELGIAADDFQVIPSYFDIDRFGEPRRLPARPATALVYDRATGPGKHLDNLCNACLCRGIQLDIVGDLIGKVPTRPEALLPNYDLVFASGRSALEALAAGCGVIIVNGGRFGELVTTQNFEAMRDANFSLKDEPIGQPRQVADLVAEVDAWDWRTLAPVSERLRQELDPGEVRLALERVYRKVIREHRDAPPAPAAESRAIAEWLIAISDQHHALDAGFLALQTKIAKSQTVRHATESREDELNRKLRTEREKVRVVRRAMLENSGLATLGIRKQIEDEWEAIQKGRDPIAPAAAAEQSKVGR